MSTPKRKSAEPHLLAVLSAEFIGTFFVVLCNCGVIAGGHAVGAELGLAAFSATQGLVVTAIIFATGAVSGAHANPIVTLGFLLRGVFPLSRAAAYIVVQFAGALLASWILQIAYPDTFRDALTVPKYTVAAAAMMELLLTAFMVFVVLSTSHQGRLSGAQSAIAVGVTVGLCGLVGKGISGSSMNPVRTLAPDFVAGKWDYWWLYIAAPLGGMLMALFVVLIIFGRAHGAELQAAQGEERP